MLRIIYLAAVAFLQAQQPAPAPHIDDNRPAVAFKEDWMDPTPGVPTDYHVKELNNHLQNKNMEHGWYGLGAKDVQYVRQLNPKTGPGYIWLGACASVHVSLPESGDYIDLATNPLANRVAHETGRIPAASFGLETRRWQVPHQR
jgi:hypothetical protein